MTDIKYDPVPHDHEAFLKKARKRGGFRETYDNLKEEYLLVREMLSARAKSGLTQEAVAELMGTTKSAVSRLESAGKHAPSITTLKKYAKAVGCDLQVKLVRKAAQPAAEADRGPRGPLPLIPSVRLTRFARKQKIWY